MPSTADTLLSHPASCFPPAPSLDRRNATNPSGSFVPMSVLLSLPPLRFNQSADVSAAAPALASKDEVLPHHFSRLHHDRNRPKTPSAPDVVENPLLCPPGDSLPSSRRLRRERTDWSRVIIVCPHAMSPSVHTMLPPAPEARPGQVHAGRSGPKFLRYIDTSTVEQSSIAENLFSFRSTHFSGLSFSRER